MLQPTNDRCRHRPRDQIIFLPTLGKQFLKPNRQHILALRVKIEIFFRRLLRKKYLFPHVVGELLFGRDTLQAKLIRYLDQTKFFQKTLVF